MNSIFFREKQPQFTVSQWENVFLHSEIHFNIISRIYLKSSICKAEHFSV